MTASIAILILKYLGLLLVFLVGIIPGVVHLMPKATQERIDLWFHRQWLSMDEALSNKSIFELIRRPIFEVIRLYSNVLSKYLGGIRGKFICLVLLVTLFSIFALLQIYSSQNIPRRLAIQELNPKEIKNLIFMYEESSGKLGGLVLSNIVSHFDASRSHMGDRRSHFIASYKITESLENVALKHVQDGNSNNRLELEKEMHKIADRTLNYGIKDRVMYAAYLRHNADLIKRSKVLNVENPYYWIVASQNNKILFLTLTGIILSFGSFLVTQALIKITCSRRKIRYLGFDLLIALFVALGAVILYWEANYIGANIGLNTSNPETPVETALQYMTHIESAGLPPSMSLHIDELIDRIQYYASSLSYGAQKVVSLRWTDVTPIESLQNWTMLLVALPTGIYMSIVVTVLVSSLQPLRVVFEYLLRRGLEVEGFILVTFHYVLSIVLLLGSLVVTFLGLR